MSTVAIACPYALDSLMGNIVTAERIAGILEELGHEVRVTQGWDGDPAEVLLVLHAVKGAEAARAFHEAHPEGKVVVLLTGTDLYRDLQDGSELGLQTLARADRLVVVTALALESLPANVRHKAVVIPKSLVLPEVRARRDEDVFGIAVVGHLREVKNPFQTVEVLARHPEWASVRVWQIGAALDADLATQARDWEERETRYRWLGSVPRAEGLGWMKKAALTVNSSWMEGAANAILEGMTLGVPVLASAVEGNLGLLGGEHGGLFPAGDDDRLASLLERAIAEPEFLESLKEQGIARAREFSRARESAGWQALLAELA